MTVSLGYPLTIKHSKYRQLFKMVVFTNHFKGSGESSFLVFKIVLKPWTPLCKIIICKDEDDDRPLNVFGTFFKLRKTRQFFSFKEKMKRKKDIRPCHKNKSGPAPSITNWRGQWGKGCQPHKVFAHVH